MTTMSPWITHEDHFDAMLEPHGRALVEAAGIDPGQRVLEVGCGTGPQLAAWAAEVGPTGRVVAVDVDPQAVARARARARVAAARLGNVSVLTGDAGTFEFVASEFDAIVSRFGLMFFRDRLAGFANLARALRPGGRLAFTCWQDPARNAWHHLPIEVARRHLPLPTGEGCVTGPFALSRVADIEAALEHAGFGVDAVTALDDAVLVGRDVEDAVRFFDETEGAPVRALLEGPRYDVLLDQLRDALTPFATDAGVLLPAAAWLVLASRRGSTSA